MTKYSNHRVQTVSSEQQQAHASNVYQDLDIQWQKLTCKELYSFYQMRPNPHQVWFNLSNSDYRFRTAINTWFHYLNLSSQRLMKMFTDPRILPLLTQLKGEQPKLAELTLSSPGCAVRTTLSYVRCRSSCFLWKLCGNNEYDELSDIIE